jgi:DNA invertase Pin-like site-specific DNA recombinase
MSARRIAISYRRFSDPKQAKGDSEDRQERDFRNFCRRHNLTPLTEVYTDRARSGYHDAHRRKGRLGQLIAAAKADRFEPGTVVVVEAWDRLGRLRPDKQTDLIAELLRTGVHIGICRLDDIFEEKDFGSHKWTTLAVFVQLAYQESKQKAERISASWEKRRELAREGRRLMTARLPDWLEMVNGEPKPIPECVAAMKRIFQLAGNGYGKARIISRLIEEKVPPFGRSGRWTAPYVDKILRDRRVLGELQPRKTDDTPDGAVICGYYPAVIAEEEYNLARAGQSERKKKGGPGGKRDRKYVNVFRSLLHCANDGEGFVLYNRGTCKEPCLILTNYAGIGGRGPTYTFPYLVFETAILRLLREVKAKDILPKEKAAMSQEDVLRAKLNNVRADMAQIQESLRRGYSKGLDAVLRERETEEEQIASQLQEELAKSVRPAEKAIKEFGTLAGMIEKEGDEARLRIRPVLRSFIEEGWVLFVRRGSFHIAAVQLHFIGGAHRDYLLVYQSAGFNRPGGAWCSSLADVAKLGPWDLRDHEDARVAAERLGELDLSWLTTKKYLLELPNADAKR